MSNRDRLNLAMDLKRLSVWTLRGETEMEKIFLPRVMKQLELVDGVVELKIRKQISSGNIHEKSEGMLTMAEILIAKAI